MELDHSQPASLEGMAIRYALYRSLFKRRPSFPLIYPGVYFTHPYRPHRWTSILRKHGGTSGREGSITIGDGVMIGPFAVIGLRIMNSAGGDSHTSRDHVLSPVAIGDDVLIGAHG